MRELWHRQSCRGTLLHGVWFPACGGRGERRERRVVSVLFADLVGFTSRSEPLDIEDVGGLLSSYQQLLQREVERAAASSRSSPATA